jgi:hypothetical protein
MRPTILTRSSTKHFRSRSMRFASSCSILHAIVSNCTTQVYGRMSSPATIQATHELMAAKGGAVEDIARLSRGEFYFTTEGLDRPVKLRAALCLSWHPPNPPTADEVAQKARAKRR